MRDRHSCPGCDGERTVSPSEDSPIEHHCTVCKGVGRLWITKKGDKIPIPRLSSRHLMNILNMLWRNRGVYNRQLLDSAYAAMSCLNGDMAQMHASHEADAIAEQSAAKSALQMVPVIKNLVEEARGRGFCDIPFDDVVPHHNEEEIT